MPTLEDFAVATEYPQQDEQTPAASQDTVTFAEFVGAKTPVEGEVLTIGDIFKPELTIEEVSQLPPAVQSFSASLGQFNAGLAKIPAAAYDIAAIPQNIVERITGWKIGTKAPEWLVNNPVAKYYDQASESYSYRRRTYPNDDLVSLIQAGKTSEAGDYLAHSVIENATYPLTAIGGTMAGVPMPVLLSILGSQTGAQTHAEARAKNLDALESASAALVNGTLEAVWESAGTFGLLKWGRELFKDVGQQTGKAIVKNVFKLVLGSFLGEGNEEIWTQLTQDFSNKMFGVEDIPWGDFPRRAIEAGAIGAVSGATMTAPGGAIEGIRASRAQQDQARAEKILEQIRPAAPKEPAAKPAGQEAPAAEQGAALTKLIQGTPLTPEEQQAFPEMAEIQPKLPSIAKALQEQAPELAKLPTEQILPRLKEIVAQATTEGQERPTEVKTEGVPNAQAPTEAEEAAKAEVEEDDTSFDFGENVAQQVEQAAAQLPEQEQDELALAAEADIIKERLVFRQRVGKFRRFAGDLQKEELAEIPRSYITRDPNAATLDKKAQELGFDSAEDLRQAIIVFESFKPATENRLSEVLRTLREIRRATLKAKTAEKKAARQLFERIERTLAKRLPASAVKGIIRRATGQESTAAKTITEPEALKRSLQRQEQVSREAGVVVKRQQKEAQQLVKRIKSADIQNMTAEERTQIQALQKELNGARTLEALRVLNQRVQALKDQGKQRFGVAKGLRDRVFELDRDVLTQTVSKGEPPAQPPVTRTEQQGKFGRIVAGTMRTLGLRAPRLLDLLDGGQDFLGPFYQTFYDRFNFGFNAEVDNTKNATDLGMQIAKDAEISADKMVSTATFDGITLNFDEMMHIYAAFGNIENKAAIAFGNKIPLEIQQKVIDFLPQEFKDAADAIVAELKANYPRTRIAMLDFSDGKTDLGQVKGPYIPMNRRDISYQATEEEILKELEARAELQKAFAKRDFTKSRVKIPPEFQAPIRLGLFQVYFNHVASREHFIQTASIVKDLQRLAHDKKLSNAIRQKYGQPYIDDLRAYVNRIANPNIYKAYSQLERLVRTARQRSAVVHLGINLVTMAKQIPSVILGLLEVGTIDLMDGMNSVLTDWEGSVEFVNRNDPQMANRQIERELEEFKRDNPEQFARTLGRLSADSLKGIGFMDRYAITAVWLAKYRQATRHGAGEKEAKRAAQGTVLRTQPAAAAKDIATIYATNEFVNMFLQFTNQLNQIYNAVTHDIPNRAKLGKTQASIRGGTAVAINAVLIWSLSHGRLPEDPEDLGEALLDTMFAMLPVIGPMLNSARKGWDGRPAALDLIVENNPFTIGEEIAKGNFGKAMDKSLYATAFTLGVPYTQVRRTVLGAFDLLAGESDDLRRVIFSEGALRKKGSGGF